MNFSSFKFSTLLFAAAVFSGFSFFSPLTAADNDSADFSANDKKIIDKLRHIEYNAPFKCTYTNSYGYTATQAQKILASGVRASSYKSSDGTETLTNSDGFFMIANDKAFFVVPDDIHFQYQGNLNAGKETTPGSYLQYSNKDVFIANLDSIITRSSDKAAFDKLTELAEAKISEKLAEQDKLREALKNNQPPPFPDDISYWNNDSTTIRTGKLDNEPCYIVTKKQNYGENFKPEPDTVVAYRTYYRKSNYVPLKIEELNQQGKVVFFAAYSDYDFDVEDSYFDSPNLNVTAFEDRDEARKAYHAYNNQYQKNKRQKQVSTTSRIATATKRQFNTGATTWMPYVAGGIGVLSLAAVLAIKLLRKR